MPPSPPPALRALASAAAALPARFDRSLLSPCLLEFCVVSDTHYMLDPGDRPLEFESRRHQTARTAAALRRIAALEPAFVLHLGDLTQSFPGSPDFERAVDEAQAQLRACGIDCLHVVAGNHDVGDKPDATAPAPVVDAASLGRHEARFGSSWYSAEYTLPGRAAPLVVVAVNSQILNGDLDAETRQRQWLEAELSRRAGQGARLVLALHLPPFLAAPDEAGLGHYDNVAEPARRWLLDLLRRHPVELLLAGHVHWAFSGRLHGAAFRVAPSPSFTRPGFGHLFASGPAPERGRDDAPKLGFLLCRVFADRIDVHAVRTGGVEDAPPPPGSPRTAAASPPAAPPAHLLTPLPSPARPSGVGVTLTHPLSWSVQVPLAWPAAVRQPARNDYPLLACQELGAGSARVPARDLGDPEQAGALAELRRAGVPLQATELWEGNDTERRLLQLASTAATFEIQLAGALLPDEPCLAFLRRWREQRPGGAAVALCPVLPSQPVPGKQHPRTRIGYRADELRDLDDGLAAADAWLDAALCRVEAGRAPAPQVEALARLLPLARVGRLDLLLSLPGVDEAADASWLAEALFAAAVLPGARAFVEPFLDLDRTMDVGFGLLDGRCNPRPALSVARCVNALLFSGAAAWQVAPAPENVAGLLRDPDSGRRALLWVPAGGGPLAAALAAADDGGEGPLALYDLLAGTSRRGSREALATVAVAGPALVMRSA